MHDAPSLYIDKGVIVSVQERARPAPPGFESVSVVDTERTLFRGLIELHNRLSYKARLLGAPSDALRASRSVA